MRKILATCLIAALSAPASAGHGGYASAARMSRIERPDKDFETHFPIRGYQPLPGSKITYLHYRWRYENPPGNLSIQLCQVQGRCVDVSKSSERTITDFSGENPARPFYFKAQIPRAASFAPLAGGYQAEIGVSVSAPDSPTR